MPVLARLIATWFGAGYAPKGPGTAGALSALACAWLYLQAGAGWLGWLVLAGLAPAIWASHVYAAGHGKDPQEVVVDEVIGQWIALAGAVQLASAVPWILAFGLFRLFDIWKPFPVRWFERLPGGVGIVMDDVMAGVYAALVMRALGWNNLY